eukprot:PhF_6_TR13378/c0_g1_i3/m.21238
MLKKIHVFGLMERRIAFCLRHMQERQEFNFSPVPSMYSDVHMQSLDDELAHHQLEYDHSLGNPPPDSLTVSGEDLIKQTSGGYVSDPCLSGFDGHQKKTTSPQSCLRPESRCSNLSFRGKKSVCVTSPTHKPPRASPRTSLSDSPTTGLSSQKKEQQENIQPVTTTNHVDPSASQPEDVIKRSDESSKTEPSKHPAQPAANSEETKENHASDSKFAPDPKSERLKQLWGEIEVTMGTLERLEKEYLSVLLDYTKQHSKIEVSKASISRMLKKLSGALPQDEDEAEENESEESDDDVPITYGAVQRVKEIRRIHADFPNISLENTFPPKSSELMATALEVACDLISKAVIIPAGVNHTDHSKESLDKLQTQFKKMQSLHDLIDKAQGAEGNLEKLIDKCQQTLLKKKKEVSNLQSATNEVDGEMNLKVKRYGQEVELLQAQAQDLRQMQPLRRLSYLKNL